MNINEVYQEALVNEDRYMILYGGAGSGKSVFAAQKIVVRCLSEENHRFLVIRKVANTLRNSTFHELKSVLRRDNLPGNINKTELTITFPNGSEIIHAGLDDPEKLKSISGVTGVWCEEATELLEDDFAEVNRRLRGDTPYYKQIILSFNPIHHQHWIKRLFFDEGMSSTYALKTTFIDNIYAGPEYYQVLEDIKDPLQRMVYIHGDWGVVSQGIIYPKWDAVDFFPVLPEHEEDEGVFYGLDFGYVAPTALVKMYIHDNSDLYIKQEIYKKGLTNDMLLDEMRRKRINRELPIYADSAAPERIEAIYEAGYDIHGAEKSVWDGILSVKEYNIHVVKPSVETMEEMRNYVWQSDKAGYFKDQPVKLNDHALDAIRYGVHSVGNAWIIA